MKVKLKDICDVRDGTHDSPVYVADGYPLVTSKNIVDGKLDFSIVSYISQEDYDKINERSKVDKGDIIMPMIGTIGNPCLVGEYTNFAIKNVALIKFPNDEVKNKFVLYFLKSDAFKRYVASKNKGGTQKFLSLGDIRNIDIPQLSLEEQTEVIIHLERVESIIELRKLELERLDDLIKSRFVEMFGNLKSNAKGWDIKTFDELTYLITDGEHSTPRRTDKGIYLLSARNVLNHSIQLEDVDYIDQEEYDRIAKRVIPRAGDVLISCSGTVGRCCSVPVGLQFQMVRSAALLRFKENINPVFAEYMITSDYLQEQINSSKTASSQANLFQGKIKALKGFVPPIELQNEFVNFVHQVDKSKVAVQKSLEETQKLFDSLMQKYFG